MKTSLASLIAACLLLCMTGEAYAQDDPALPTFPGTIAYLGADFNVYTLDGQGGTRAALTSDAGPADDHLQIYQWPTWSTDGRLAYFGLSLGEGARVLATDIYVSSEGTQPGTLVYNGVEQVFNYAYWSPQNCADGENCRDLAVLLTDPAAGGLLVELIRDTADAPGSESLGTGTPFYFSWSPDGARMLWRRGTERIDVYDVEAGEIVDTLVQSPGMFQAPAWSPVDDRLLFGARSSSGSATDLIIVANGEAQTLAADLDGAVSFGWSPDGNRVAYMTDQGVLFAVDAVTGETVARSPSSGVIAFFWSPDSQQIAYVTLAASPGSFSASAGAGGQQAALTQETPGLLWSVLDVETDSARRYTTFIPSRDMIYLLSYFDQFAQSHRIWSPDSHHLLYGEVTADETSVITLLDVTSTASVPLSIAEGYIAVWSFE